MFTGRIFKSVFLRQRNRDRDRKRKDKTENKKKVVDVTLSAFICASDLKLLNPISPTSCYKEPCVVCLKNLIMQIWTLS